MNHRKVQADPLYNLVKSMTKSEKRQFKLYANRLDGNADAKFLLLFELLDRMKFYDENQLLNADFVKRQQLSNLKAHLYKQILVSLRLGVSSQTKSMKLREQLDFANILYNKGLYKQSLKILDRIKSQALAIEETSLALQIVELEKIIESQHIVGDIEQKAPVLAKESETLSKANQISSSLSNLSIELYAMILRSGYVKNDKEYHKVTHFFNGRLPEINLSSLGFREKLWYYQSHMWYGFLVQDFLSAYKFANKWVGLFFAFPDLIPLHPVFFVRGHQFLFEALYLLKYRSKFEEALIKFEQMLTQINFPDNRHIAPLIFLGRYHNKINFHFLEGSFDDAQKLIPDVLHGIEIHHDSIDRHHVMVLYYKIACIYFGVGDYKNCIAYLEKIIHNKNLVIHDDLMCFSRVLYVVAHYEAGFDYQLETQLKHTYKFLLKMNELQAVQKAMLQFLRSLTDLYPGELKAAFQRLHEKLKAYENDPYEKRAFLYLDIISWLESKIDNRPIASVIKEKAAVLIR